jgi:hypothetical protein
MFLLTHTSAQIKFANGTSLNMNSSEACKTLYQFAKDVGPGATVNDTLKIMQKEYMDSVHDPVKNFMPDPPRELVANCMGIQR